MEASITTIHVVQHLAPGGLEALAINMLTFSKPSNSVLIVSLEGTKEQALATWPRLKEIEDQILFLDKPAGYSITTLYSLYKLFRCIKPHVVHTHHIGPMLYGATAARMAGVKSRIHTEHDAWHLSNSKHRSLQGLALKIAKPTLVADANLVREQLNNHFNKQDVRVIKNGIDCETFKPGSKHLARQALSIPLDKTIIGSAGRLEHVKGHDLLIQAMALLPDTYHLVIAGGGSQRQMLTELVNHLGLEERVTFLGLVDDMPRFYQSLDLFCLPSRSEGFPLSTLEAQSCDIVTLCTNAGASKETLCPHTGWLVSRDSVETMAKGIWTALHETVSHSPREFVTKHNDIRQMVQAYHNLAQEKLA